MNAKELLHTYLSSIQNAAAAAALFADDGIIELPTVNERAQGPVATHRFVTGLLAKVPDFRFENVRIWIETPDWVFGEYDAQDTSCRRAHCTSRPTRVSSLRSRERSRCCTKRSTPCGIARIQRRPSLTPGRVPLRVAWRQETHSGSSAVPSNVEHFYRRTPALLFPESCVKISGQLQSIFCRPWLNHSPLRPSRRGCTLDSCEAQCDHPFRSRAGSE
jgi:hypothetical protein